MANGRTVLPGPELMLSLTPGTSITFIDDQPVILSRDRRALFEVNQIGGYIGCRLEEGISLRQLAEEVGDRGFGPASAMLRAVLSQWSHSGLVNALDDPPASPPALAQSLALAGKSFLLRYHDDALAAHVAPLFSHLETAADEAETSYDLWSAHGLTLLSQDGGRASVLQAREAGPVIKACIIQDIIGDGRSGLALHAGCLHRNGRALLLTGRPGAGKTTLISWLAGNGFDYQGDDITLLHEDGRVQGLPFLPTIKSGAWPMMTARYGDLLHPAVHARPDNKRVRYLASAGSGRQATGEVGWIVKLRRARGCAARLEPVPSTTSIKHLLSEAASATGEVDRGTLGRLILTVSAARTCELHYDDLDEAAALLEGFCDHGAA
ncbi:MAG TPA: hypothetical protein VJM09_16995 [Sphingobium sp.]|nr:hypothetical protein [Sphingobium sp.]